MIFNDAHLLLVKLDAGSLKSKQWPLQIKNQIK